MLKSVPMLQFGKKFTQVMSMTEQIIYLKKLASAMNEAARILLGERDTAYVQASAQEAQLKATEKMRSIQDMVTRKQLAKANEQNNSQLQKISQLQRRVKELEADGSND